MNFDGNDGGDGFQTAWKFDDGFGGLEYADSSGRQADKTALAKELESQCLRRFVWSWRSARERYWQRFVGAILGPVK